MSAFMVEDKTINVVVTKLSYDRDGEWLKRKIGMEGYNLDILEGRRKLGWDMFGLNARAVNQRYSDHPADSFRALNYKLALEGNYTRVSALKALRCWLYQCTEGDSDETSLYKLMQEVSHDWALNIVRSMSEWDKAIWN